MRRWNVWGVVAAVAMLTGTAVGCRDNANGAPKGVAEAADEVVQPLDSAVRANVPAGEKVETAEAGRKLFLTCAVCHGPDARGTQLGPSLRDGEWVDIDGSLPQIERVIRDGVPDPEEFDIPMPVLGGGTFDAEQVHALAVYVYALSRERTSPSDSTAA